MAKKKNKNPFKMVESWVGAIVPIFLLWGFFMVLVNSDPDFGYGLALFMMATPIVGIIGFLIGWGINRCRTSKKWGVLIGAVIGLVIGLVYFLIKYIPYSSMPSIDQRGFGEEFLISVAIGFICAIIGTVIGLFTEK